MPVILRLRLSAALPLLFALTVLAALFVVVQPSVQSAEAATRAQRVARGLTVIRAQQGDPYRYGAAGPNAFDCSGLVYFSYRRAGIDVPRTSDAQARFARRISRSNLRPGDLVFFHSGGNVYHVGVYAGRAAGQRTVLHAPSTGKRVNRDPIWTNSWFAGTLR